MGKPRGKPPPGQQDLIRYKFGPLSQLNKPITFAPQTASPAPAPPPAKRPGGRPRLSSITTEVQERETARSVAERATVRLEDRKKKASAAAGSGRVYSRYTDDHKRLQFSLLPECGDATATCRHALKHFSALLPEDASQDALERALRRWKERDEVFTTEVDCVPKANLDIATSKLSSFSCNTLLLLRCESGHRYRL